MGETPVRKESNHWNVTKCCASLHATTFVIPHQALSACQVSKFLTATSSLSDTMLVQHAFTDR